MRAGVSARYDGLRHQGEAYQDYISDCWLMATGRNLRVWSSEYMQRIAETKDLVEIKNDTLMHKTGNVWIECEERTDVHKQFVRSGILRTNQNLLIIGDRVHAHILKVHGLYEELMQAYLVGEVAAKQIDTSRGFLVPVRVLVKLPHYRGDLIETLRQRDDGIIDAFLKWGAKEDAREEHEKDH